MFATHKYPLFPQTLDKRFAAARDPLGIGTERLRVQCGFDIGIREIEPWREVQVNTQQVERAADLLSQSSHRRRAAPGDHAGSRK